MNPIAMNVLAAYSVSATSIVVGASSIAILYGLHHLRAQPQRQRVATLLFWQHAMRADAPRILRPRAFARWRTFALLATVLLLLAATFSTARWGKASPAAIVIDAGTETRIVDRDGTTLLGRLSQAAIADAPGFGSGVAVIAAGATPQLRARSDEPLACAVNALSSLRPMSGASAAALALPLAGAVLGDGNGKIHWYTSRSILPDGLPAELRERIVLHTQRASESVAITGISFEPAPDGSAKGVLRVIVAGTRAGAMTVRLTDMQGAAATRSGTATTSSPGRVARAEIAFNDRPADGRPVTLQLLDASDAPVSDAATFHVPDLRPIAFRFDANTPSAVRLALTSIGVDATAAPATTAGSIFVAPAGVAVPSDAVAAILVVNEGGGVSAGSPLHLADGPLTRGLTLEDSVAAEGPVLRITGTPLIEADTSAVAELDRAGARPTLLLSGAIINGRATLPGRAAFPILLRRLCDVLVGRGGPPAALQETRAALDPLWPGAPSMPPPAIAIVADPPLPMKGAASSSPSEERRRGWSIGWSEALLATAFALLLVESLLYARRKII